MFTPIDIIGKYFDAVNGLLVTLNRLVHPSIMSNDAILKLFFKVVSVCEHHEGRAEIAMLSDALCARIAEHVAAVRKYPLTPQTQRKHVPPL